MVRLLLWLALIVPWFTILFLDKDTVKRYMPVTVFTCLLMTIVFEIGYTFKWWTIHQYIVPWGYMIDVSFAYGVFAVGTLWIFYFTSHKFWVYAVTNCVIDALFTFVGLTFVMPWIGIAAYTNMWPWQLFLLFLALSLVIFGYHRWQQGIFARTVNTERERNHGRGEYEVRRTFRIRTKAK